MVVGCGPLTLTLQARQATPPPTRVYNEAAPGIVLPTVISREQPPSTRAALEAQVAGEASGRRHDRRGRSFKTR